MFDETRELFQSVEETHAGLAVNVWKSAKTAAGKKPVMVWIHGGAFEAGGTADLQKIDAQKILEASAVLAMRQFPERDGIHLPLDPWEAYAKGAAKDIAILQGCNKDEMNFFVHSFGEDVFKVWAAGGKSYTYYFTPESSLPIVKSGHSIELASVFNHPEMTADTGRTLDQTFAKTMRKMWVQFAKTGNPSLSADLSPDGRAKVWPLYDLKQKQVMVFDENNIHPEREASRKIVDWDRTYFLTKYYVF